jgi:hypothetical protein
MLHIATALMMPSFVKTVEAMMPAQNRRAEVLATADVALCTNVHSYVREHHLDQLINALVNGETANAEGTVSSSVASWCATNASFDDDDSRRRVESQWDAYEAMLGLDLGAQDQDPEHGSPEYLEMVHQTAKESRRLANLRRLSQQTEEDVELPAEMWQQCAGYAFAINKMVTTIDDGTGSFAAAIFAMSTSGGPEENMNACGAVVNSVNAALDNGVLGEGMHKQEDGSVMIAASHPDALQFEQLGLSTISFTIGGVVQAGYMIMKICTSYQSQIAIV